MISAKKCDSRQAFNQSVHNLQPEIIPVKPLPKMIREDQPVPRPKPPVIGRAVDRQSFNRRWQQEVNAAKPLDAFDAIDQQHKHNDLQHHFGEQTHTGKKRGFELD